MILFKGKKSAQAKKSKSEKEKPTQAKQAPSADLSAKDKKTQKSASATAEKKKPSMRQLYEQEAKAKPAPAKSVEQKRPKSQSQRAYRVLVRPVVTEKASIVAAESKYIFEVSARANKIEIAKAIFELYGIKPVKVNIIKVKGKQVRSGQIVGRRKDRKKAIVTLPKGESINVYEGV